MLTLLSAFTNLERLAIGMAVAILCPAGRGAAAAKIASATMDVARVKCILGK